MGHWFVPLNNLTSQCFVQWLMTLSTQNRQKKRQLESKLLPICLMKSWRLDQIAALWPLQSCGAALNVSNRRPFPEQWLITKLLWISLVCDHWNGAFMENNKTSEHFLTHPSLAIILRWIESLWSGQDLQWKYNFNNVSHARLHHRDKAFSSLLIGVRQALH